MKRHTINQDNVRRRQYSAQTSLADFPPRTVPLGHKIALSRIARGDRIVKYAVTIGLASCDIAPGEHVHSHNVEDITNRLCNEYERAFRAMKG